MFLAPRRKKPKVEGFDKIVDEGGWTGSRFTWQRHGTAVVNIWMRFG